MRKINDDLFDEIFGDRSTEKKSIIKDFLFSLIEDTAKDEETDCNFSKSNGEEVYLLKNILSIENLD